MIRSFITSYIKLETVSGLLLIFVSFLAILAINIDYISPLYTSLQNLSVGISIGDFVLKKSLLHWVNDGLMTLFFFLITLEIKREIIQGELSTYQKAILPVIGAIGGIVVPACIFVLFNIHTPENIRGWAIPIATDIAFALGILTLLGRRVPVALKIFLTTLAVVDDLVAILVLAVFYTEDINTVALLYAGLVCIVMFTLGYYRVVSASIYLAIGFVLWFCLLKSGLHATLAGVITALAIPYKKGKEVPNPVEHIEHRLHGWVNFCILPIFAFVNAGVAIPKIDMGVFTPLSLGIIVGLFAGKQIGVFGFCFLAIKAKIARLPKAVSKLQLYGVSALCGVGFTMSLFIGSIGFGHTDEMNSVRLSVVFGSLLSALLGVALLYSCRKRKKARRRT